MSCKNEYLYAEKRMEFSDEEQGTVCTSGMGDYFLNEELTEIPYFIGIYHKEVYGLWQEINRKDRNSMNIDNLIRRRD